MAKTATPTVAKKKATAVKKTPAKKPASKSAAAKLKKKSELDEPAVMVLHAAIIAAMQDVKASRIVSLDLRKIDDAIADFFIVCEGDASVHVKAIADKVEEEIRKKRDEKPWHVEGIQNLEWVIVDYVNIVLHVFKKETREFYKLEDLWEDAERTTFE